MTIMLSWCQKSFLGLSHKMGKDAAFSDVHCSRWPWRPPGGGGRWQSLRMLLPSPVEPWQVATLVGASSIVRPGKQSPFVLDQMADTQTLALSSVDTRTQRVATGGHWKANIGDTGATRSFKTQEDKNLPKAQVEKRRILCLTMSSVYVQLEPPIKSETSDSLKHEGSLMLVHFCKTCHLKMNVVPWTYVDG